MPETARPVKHRRRKNQRLCEKLNRLESQLGERVQFLFFLLRKKKNLVCSLRYFNGRMDNRSMDYRSHFLFLPRSRKVGTEPRHKMAGRREQVSKLVSPLERPTPAGAFYSPKYLREEVSVQRTCSP